MQPTTFPHWATWQHLSGVVRGGMPVTSRPWSAWQGWVAARADGTDRNSRRRMRLSLHDIADLRDIKVDWSRLPRPEITFYTPNQIRHLIRFDGSLGRALPTSGWLPAQARDPASHWRLPDLTHIQLPAAASPAPPAPPHAWLESAARGLPLGAIVLVLLVLLARVADKCLDTSFFRRRRSSEWPAANVTATSNPGVNAAVHADLPHNEVDSFGSEASCPSSAPDLPPPYSECARSTVSLPRKAEDPPPPYNSACYVAFSNTKAGMPSVHFYNNLYTGNNRATRISSPTRDLHIYGFDLDTGQTPSAADGTATGCEGGLVFESGRVVEGGTRRTAHHENNGPNDSCDSSDSNVNNANGITRSDRDVFIA